MLRDVLDAVRRGRFPSCGPSRARGPSPSRRSGSPAADRARCCFTWRSEVALRWGGCAGPQLPADHASSALAAPRAGRGPPRLVRSDVRVWRAVDSACAARRDAVLCQPVMPTDGSVTRCCRGRGRPGRHLLARGRRQPLAALRALGGGAWGRSPCARPDSRSWPGDADGPFRARGHGRIRCCRRGRTVVRISPAGSAASIRAVGPRHHEHGVSVRRTRPRVRQRRRGHPR